MKTDRHAAPSREEPRKECPVPPQGSRRSLRRLKQGRDAVRCVSWASRRTDCVESGPTGRRGARGGKEQQGGGRGDNAGGSDCRRGRGATEENGGHAQ